jgi:hypothetical protein
MAKINYDLNAALSPEDMMTSRNTYGQNQNNYETRLYNSMLQQNPTALQDFIRRLQLSGMIGSTAQGNDKVLYGGGRLGYRFPMGKDDLTVGLSGGGYNAKGQGYDQTNLDFQGIDANYQMGDQNFGGYYRPEKMGLTYRSPNVGNVDVGYSPTNKLLELLYAKSF